MPADDDDKQKPFKLVFKDSLSFLNSSLASLAGNLDIDALRYTADFARKHGIPLNLLRRKGVYPYAWLNDTAKFQDTCLPPQAAFRNDLGKEDITFEDYEHARLMWDAFECKSFGQYHDRYLELDVHLLADIFETFRSRCLADFSLDPAHFFTLPGYSWSCLLKHTQIELELLTDIDMHISIDSSIRGGVCVVSQRLAEANNPEVEGYDANRETSSLLYLDANALYAHAMGKALPIDKYRWGDVAGWNRERILSQGEDDPEGAFLCVDVDYPVNLHDAHNDYPLLPERQKVPWEKLSPYQQRVWGDVNYKPHEKLIGSLENKRKYWIHVLSLKFALEQGLRLVKIHQVIEFRQGPWMKPYIDRLTQMRQKAANAFEKDLYKLMVNALFGKTMENVRNRRDIQAMFHGSEKFRRWVANPGFASRNRVGANLVIAERTRCAVTLDKPVPIGSAVLDISKLHMQKFWHETLRPKVQRLGGAADLLYTDTDSLITKITFPAGSNAMLDISGGEGTDYDTSDYPKDHPLFSDANKKVTGKFKDESKGLPIAGFVGLRAKLYATKLGETAHGKRVRLEEESGVPAAKRIKLETKKSKGTKMCVTEKEIVFEDYKKTLFTGESMSHSQQNFRSHSHQVFTVNVTKTSLSAFDSKRYILDDGNKTLAFGHRSIKLDRVLQKGALRECFKRMRGSLSHMHD